MLASISRKGILRKRIPLSQIFARQTYGPRYSTALPKAPHQLKEAGRTDLRMLPNDYGYQLVRNRKPDQLKKILLVSTSLNSLTTAVQMHLEEKEQYDLDVAAVSSGKDIKQAVEKAKPDLVICPYLTKKIPTEVYENNICWIVHPGIVGDRGAYSLDYALLKYQNWKPENERWGVTVMQAHEEYDAGAIWATKEFPLYPTTKSELYHTNVTRAVINALDTALESYKNPKCMPISLENYPDARGHKQVPLLQNKRQFSWEHDSAETIARKINAASGQPGIKTDLMGEEYFFYNAYVDGSDLVDQHYTENQKRDFYPGQMMLKMNGGLLFATNTPNEFVWITQMKKSGSFKIPAEQAFQKHSTLKNFLNIVPEHTPKSHEELSKMAWKEIHYDIDANLGVAYLHFDFCNGAMSTDQAYRLRSVYDYLAKERSDVRTIVLMGGRDSFSNGIHLNVIHNAEDPVLESTRNIEAIDDVTKSVLNTTDKLVISFLRCGAGAGGVMLPLASDLVWCDSNAVLHPYYKHMGLYGSEYWTYTLPRRVGDSQALALTEECKPVSAKQAARIGLVDQLVEFSETDGLPEVQQMVQALLFNFNWEDFLKKKAKKFDPKEAEKCREHELQQMYDSFRSAQYQSARDAFVH